MSQESETKSTTSSVLAEVASALEDSPEQVRIRVRGLLVEREVSKRVDLLDKGLAKLRELKREVEKVRVPVSYTLDGQKVEGTLSKQDFEALKKAKEKLAKLESAMEKAWQGKEFDKLSNLVAGKDAPSENEGE